MSLKFIDLFAGIGGFRLALESFGGECVFSSEWDKFAQQTYSANFDDLPYGDITQIKSHEIPDHDVLCAGFPCQPFSLAGVSKMNSLGYSHGFAHKTQGNLFFEVARIINDKQPEAFILENVKNLMSHEKGNTFKTIHDVLVNDLNYTIYYKVIDSSCFVPQKRQRIFIVGFKNPLDFRFEELDYSSPPAIKSILEKRVDSKFTLSDHLWQYLQNHAEKHRARGHGFGFGLVDLNGVSRTLSARYHKDGSEILIPQKNKNPRRLTPRECARIMGYPDDYKIVCSNTRAYKQFGNSVVVPVVKYVANCMLNSLNNGVELPKHKQLDLMALAA
jgi:DNA (cytosine-5)-methyltransferase 1